MIIIVLMMIITIVFIITSILVIVCSFFEFLLPSFMFSYLAGIHMTSYWEIIIPTKVFFSLLTNNGYESVA